jgi:hypothetical protein
MRVSLPFFLRTRPHVAQICNLLFGRSPIRDRADYKTALHEKASILLEVVLALALFVGAATVVTAGINASIQAVHRVRLQNHAANLAISLMSELQMHARPLAAVGPESFEAPFQDWLYRVAVEQGQESAGEPDSLRPVEVIVWNPEEGVTHRLTQFFQASELGTAQTEAETLVP